MASLGPLVRDWAATSTPDPQLSGPTSAPSLSYTAILQCLRDPVVGGQLLAIDAVGVALQQHRHAADLAGLDSGGGEPPPPAVLAPRRELDEPHHLRHAGRGLVGLLARPQGPLAGDRGPPPPDTLPHLVRTPQPDELRVAERGPQERKARIGPGGRAQRGPERVKTGISTT